MGESKTNMDVLWFCRLKDRWFVVVSNFNSQKYKQLVIHIIGDFKSDKQQNIDLFYKCPSGSLKYKIGGTSKLASNIAQSDKKWGHGDVAEPETLTPHA